MDGTLQKELAAIKYAFRKLFPEGLVAGLLGILSVHLAAPWLTAWVARAPYPFGVVPALFWLLVWLLALSLFGIAGGVTVAAGGAVGAAVAYKRLLESLARQGEVRNLFSTTILAYVLGPLWRTALLGLLLWPAVALLANLDVLVAAGHATVDVALVVSLLVTFSMVLVSLGLIYSYGAFFWREEPVRYAKEVGMEE